VLPVLPVDPDGPVGPCGPCGPRGPVIVYDPIALLAIFYPIFNIYLSNHLDRMDNLPDHTRHRHLQCCSLDYKLP
jgi:hypothetical protein